MTAPLVATPDWAVALFVLLTQLGDVWLLFVVLGVLYWTDGHFPVVGRVADRRRAAFLVALALGALAVTVGLKGYFAVARPPGAGTAQAPAFVPRALGGLYESAATARGFSFPSGHAVGATAVWGGAAVVLDGPDTRRSALLAALVVALIALSRVVLGVHYAADVVAGVGVGLGFLALVVALCGAGERPGRAFSLALVAAVLAALVVGYERDTMAVLGATIAGRLTWGALGGALQAAAVDRYGGYLTAAVGLGVVGGGLGAVYVVDPAPHLAFVGNAAVVAAMLAFPLIGAALPGSGGATAARAEE